MKNETCATCKFRGPEGLCQRNPPTVAPEYWIAAKANISWDRGVWPTTLDDEWCGEYRDAR